MDGFWKAAQNLIGNTEGGGGEETNDFIGRTIRVGESAYRIHRILAEGGYAYVFLAENTTTREMFALKRIIIPDKEHMAATKLEVKFMRLGRKHKSIVGFVDFANISSRETSHNNAEALVVMELCPGSLFNVLHNLNGGFKPPVVYHVFKQVVEGVKFLHAQQPPIIHRDLKVENVLLSKDGHARICDFGSATVNVMAPQTSSEISRAEDEIQAHTTPQYRSPEMWDLYSRVPIDYKSDLWALGSILYKICYYRTPFDEGSKLLACNADLRLPGGGENSIFHPIIKALMTKEPERRPDCDRVLQMLEDIKGNVGAMRRSDMDVLKIPMDTGGSLAAGTEGVKNKLSGYFNTLKESVQNYNGAEQPQSNDRQRYENEDGRRQQRSQQQHQQQQQQQRPPRRASPPPAVPMCYVTPRVIACTASTQPELNDLKEILDKKFPRRCFVINMSNKVYDESFFGEIKVRHANWPVKGILELAKLYEICQSMEAWLLADRQNVVLAHCADGFSRSGLVISAFMLYCGLFPTVAASYAFYAMNLRNTQSPKPSIIRQLKYLNGICSQKTPIHNKKIRICSVSYTLLPSFQKSGRLPYFVVVQGGSMVHSAQQTIADVGNDRVSLPSDFFVVGDFVILLMLTVSGKSQVICQLPLYSGCLATGKIDFRYSELESPHRSLNDSFSMSVRFDHSDGSPTNMPQPWLSDKQHKRDRNLACRTCFFSDSEADKLMEQYDRETKLAPSPRPPSSPPRSSVRSREPTRPSDAPRSRPEPRKQQAQPAKQDPSPLLDFGSDGSKSPPAPKHQQQSYSSTSSARNQLFGDSEGSSSFGDSSSNNNDTGSNQSNSNPLFDIFDDGPSQTTASSQGNQINDFDDFMSSTSATMQQEQPPPQQQQPSINLLDIDGFSGSSSPNNNSNDLFANSGGGLTATDSIPRSNSDIFSPHSPTNIPRNHSDSEFIDFEHHNNNNNNNSSNQSNNLFDLNDAFSNMNTSPSPNRNNNLSNNNNNNNNSNNSNPFGNFSSGSGSAGTNPFGQTHQSQGSGFNPTPVMSPSQSPQMGRSNQPLKPNANVGMNMNRQTATKPKNSDPFSSLGGFGSTSPNTASKNTPSKPSTTAAAASTNPFGNSSAPNSAGNLNSSGSNNWQQQRHQQQQNAQAAKDRAQAQRAQHHQEQANRRMQQQNQNKWKTNNVKKPNTNKSGGGFEDLLSSHGFQANKGAQKPQTMAERKEAEIIANDVDGTGALKLKIAKWKSGKEGNIRALLSSLPDVLWEGAVWNISMANVLNSSDVKKGYRKACLLTHPDRANGKDYEPLARLIFDELVVNYNLWNDAGCPGLG